MAEADPCTTFNVHAAKSNLSKLMDRAHAGEEIILAKHGEPWAKMVPIAPVVTRRRPGGLAITAPIPDSVFLDPLPDEDLTFIDDRPPNERL